MDFWQLVLLGAIAGFTIFLGLPIALLHKVSIRKKTFLNAFATGILVFLIIDVFSHAWESASSSATQAAQGKVPAGDAILNMLALFGGLAIGLMSLVWYEKRYMRNTPPSRVDTGSTTGSSIASTPDGAGTSLSLDGGSTQQAVQVHAYKVAMMIAIGIGAHNFSEGLAIGQSFATGAIGLAIVLIIGFGSHNATEGFGIAGPLTRLTQRPNVRFLLMAGLVGGGPTFLGTILGSLWVSEVASILFLSLAGGALIYVTMLMYGSMRKHATNALLMAGILVGLCAGFATDLIVSLGGA